MKQQIIYATRPDRTFCASVTRMKSGSFTVRGTLAGHTVHLRTYPASMQQHAIIAADYYRLTGYLPCCPRSTRDGWFWARPETQEQLQAKP